jgi:co-chaperonin GroES (HSP10)
MMTGIPELLAQTRHQAHAIAVGQPQVEQNKFRHADVKLMQRILFTANPYDVKPLI